MTLKFEKFSITAIFLVVVVLVIFFSSNSYAQDIIEKPNDIHLHMFYGQGCPHCGSLKLFLDSIKDKYSSLIIHEHEVYQNQQERELFERMSKDFNAPIEGVPTVFIDDRIFVGFSNAIGVSMENQIKRCLEINCSDPEYKRATSETTQLVGESSPSTDPEKKEIMQSLTIPIVIFAAAVDAINPCAFAVLIILMTAALAITDKKRALKFGLAFSASIYISYFLMGCGLFSALQVSGISHTFYSIVTILAVIVGLLNIKDYFWYGKGFLMEVPLSWRPTMKKILNSATTPFGAFIAGLAVSLFELPCTGGPYIVILGLLAREVTRSTGFFYLLLYNLVFISPLIILSLLIYKGLSTTAKLEEIRLRRIRLLHLIAGILMLIIATAMILSLMKGWV
ncbi:cytochrome c biogenesis protein [Candidatus Falkowbacteria bacterium]|nr:cytochrome c biogenesis protein [Candidatus Falkowbacteria bacterium]